MGHIGGLGDVGSEGVQYVSSVVTCENISCSVGKSTLLTMLTGTHSEAASYEFTTLTCIPGIIHYNDTKIQLLDLPGIIEGASEGKGRGRQVNASNT
jgi:small GTP-binding protein